MPQRQVSARVLALRGVVRLPGGFDEKEFKSERLASRFGARALRVGHRADALWVSHRVGTERAQGEKRIGMSDNALVDEIREIRHRIASECGNDPLKIALRAAEAARRFTGEASHA